MAFEKGKNNNNNYEAKEAKLHEQIGRLSVENDWLKKKWGSKFERKTNVY